MKEIESRNVAGASVDSKRIGAIADIGNDRLTGPIVLATDGHRLTLKCIAHWKTRNIRYIVVHQQLNRQHSVPRCFRWNGLVANFGTEAGVISQWLTTTIMNVPGFGRGRV